MLEVGRWSGGGGAAGADRAAGGDEGARGERGEGRYGGDAERGQDGGPVREVGHGAQGEAERVSTTPASVLTV